MQFQASFVRVGKVKTGMMSQLFFIISALLAVVLTACGEQEPEVVAPTEVVRPADGTITIDPNVTYQTMLGWEAGATIGQGDFPNEYSAWRDEVLEIGVNELGINRIRLAVRSGAENPADYYTPYRTGEADFERFVETRYAIVNDNNDPFTINWTGFNFAEMDHKMEDIVLPIKSLIEANGESLYLNLTYVDFESSDFEHHNFPEEYAEYMEATFLYMQDTYGFVPDSLEIILEPDNSENWSPAKVGEAIIATVPRLQNHGFEPDIVAPSTKTMAAAVEYFDEMSKMPNVVSHIDEFAYHRYGRTSNDTLRDIRERGEDHNIRTAMLERIGSDQDALYNDLTIAGVSSWQQFTLAYPTEDNGAQYIVIDMSNRDNPSVRLGKRTKFLRQFFKYVRTGAVRIEAESNVKNFKPVAFTNKNGSAVVVVIAKSSGEISIEGLPNGNYGVSYATGEDEESVQLDDKALSDGETLIASMPSPGVITIYGK